MCQALSAQPQPILLRVRASGSLELSQGQRTYPFLLTGITGGPGGPAGQFTINRHQCDTHTPRLSALGKALIDCVRLKRVWPFTSKGSSWENRVKRQKRIKYTYNHPPTHSINMYLLNCVRLFIIHV